MVALDRIYTRGGDAGETSLGDGERVKKHSLRVETYGTVDEVNAVLGLARLHASPEADAMLARIQNDLFDLGADLCRPHDRAKGPTLRVSDAQVTRLETEIDAINAGLDPLRSFVLPGGAPAPLLNSTSPAPWRGGRSDSSLRSPRPSPWGEQPFATSIACRITCSFCRVGRTTTAPATCYGSLAPTGRARRPLVRLTTP